MIGSWVSCLCIDYEGSLEEDDDDDDDDNDDYSNYFK